MTELNETAASVERSSTKLLTFTIDADTAQIVRLESLDASGARHELSEDEKATLVKEGGEDRLEAVLERAFEAGIACVLDSGVVQETEKESQEDTELRHLLLAPLIEHSPARHLMEHDVLNRAILDTLVEHSMKSRAGARDTTAAARAH